jgi:hypothetical protein
MLALLVTITIFSFLYGFVWHNQPAQVREHSKAEGADTNSSD